jgi:hypothetical protein
MNGSLLLLAMMIATFTALLTANFSSYVRGVATLARIDAAFGNEQNVLERIRAEDITIMRQFQVNSTNLRLGMNQALQNNSPPAWATSLVTPHNPLGMLSVNASVTGVTAAGAYTPSGDTTSNRVLQWYDSSSNLLHTDLAQTCCTPKRCRPDWGRTLF